MRIADFFALAIAVSLPWSSSVLAIVLFLWLIAIIPTLGFDAVRREVMTAAGGFPVAFWIIAVVGMFWADVSWSERLGGLDSLHKLLVIPLLMAHFRRSNRGGRVVNGFLISCAMLAVVSWALALLPGLPWRGKEIGVPVKDYISQAILFVICICILADRLWDCLERKQVRQVFGLAAIILLFGANIVYVVTARTALVVLPVLLLLLGFRRLAWKGGAIILLLGSIFLAIGWGSSPYLRMRVVGVYEEIKRTELENADTSSGQRLEFWRKSLRFIASAPLIGHGTGSITEQFRDAVVGNVGPASVASANPHQQILATAIQLGFVGAIVLIAMWVAHLVLFNGAGPVAWIGTVFVVQNIVGSLFNSHLFDFTHGWIYVVGVGVVGGMIRHKPNELRHGQSMLDRVEPHAAH
ncbi:MAG TPA: O-antigen ligase family protein [Xanthobacteraceae bacterium]|nr:O-antigen ligase family protein [Xanthobacteraceae bacterium]